MKIQKTSPYSQVTFSFSYILALCLLVWVVYNSLTSHTINSITTSNQTTTMMRASLLYYVLLITLVFILAPNTPRQLIPFRLQIKSLLLLLLISQSLSFISLNFFPQHHLPSYESQTHHLQQIKSKYLLLYLGLMTLSAYSEELFFRVLPLSFSHKHPMVTMLIWQTSFALVHVPTQEFYAIIHAIMGIIYWISLRQGISVHTIVWAHLTHNLITLL